MFGISSAQPATVRARPAPGAGYVRRLLFSVSLCLCGAVLSPAAALASDAAVPGVGAMSILKVLFGLAVVLGAVVAAGWLARRMSPAPLGGGWLRVQSGVSVGARERVMLVEIEDTWLIVGVAPGQVSLLHTMPRPPQAAAASAGTASPANFSAWLKNTLERRGRA